MAAVDMTLVAVTLAQLSEVTRPLTLPRTPLAFTPLLLIPTPLLPPPTPLLLTVPTTSLEPTGVIWPSLCECLVLVLVVWVREHMHEAPLSQWAWGYEKFKAG